MDPITLAIISALAKLSESVIKDSYDALKAVIVRKFGGDSELSKSLDNLEKKPDSTGRRETLKEEVASAQADQDPEVLQVAQALIAKIKELPGGQTIITQTVTGNQNIFSGSGDVTVTQRSDD